MTLVARYLDPPAFADLGAAGWARVGLAEVVGIWGVGPIVRVVLLGGEP